MKETIKTNLYFDKASLQVAYKIQACNRHTTLNELYNTDFPYCERGYYIKGWGKRKLGGKFPLTFFL